MIADQIANAPAPGPVPSASCSCCTAIDSLPAGDAAELRAIIRGEITNPHTGKRFADREVAAWLGAAAGRHLTAAHVTNCRLRHFGVTRRS